MLTQTLSRPGTQYDVPFAPGWPPAELRSEFMEALAGALDAAGSEVASLEREFAAYVGARFALAVGSGATALQLVLRGLHLRPGDEVIAAANCLPSAAAGIAHAGGRPVFVDVAADQTLDTEAVAAAVTPRSRVLLVSHPAGRPAPLPAVLELAERHNLAVVEDATGALGARLQGQPVGVWGRAAYFHLADTGDFCVSGDAGLIVTRDPGLVDYLDQARSGGRSARGQCAVWGHEVRLDDLRAALLRTQLGCLDRCIEERHRLAARYSRNLAAVVDVPTDGPDASGMFSVYAVQAPRRDELCRHLREHGIEAVVPPGLTALQPAARSLGYRAAGFPHAVRAVANSLWLPLYPSLSDEQQDQVISRIEAFYEC